MSDIIELHPFADIKNPKAHASQIMGNVKLPYRFVDRYDFNGKRYVPLVNLFFMLTGKEDIFSVQQNKVTSSLLNESFNNIYKPYIIKRSIHGVNKYSYIANFMYTIIAIHDIGTLSKPGINDLSEVILPHDPEILSMSFLEEDYFKTISIKNIVKALNDPSSTEPILIDSSKMLVLYTTQDYMTKALYGNTTCRNITDKLQNLRGVFSASVHRMSYSDKENFIKAKEKDNDPLSLGQLKVLQGKAQNYVVCDIIPKLINV